MSTTLAQLRSRVRERGSYTVADIAYPDKVIDRHINMALAGLMSANPNGWWWNHIEVTWQNTTGNDLEYVAGEPYGVYAYDVKSQRVQSVFVSRDGDFWQPLDYRTSDDATRLSGGRPRSDGLPLIYTTMQGQGVQAGSVDYNGVVMRFSPPLANGTWIRFIATIGAPDLALAGDVVQGWPDIWMDAVVETAAASLMRQRKVLGSLQRRAMLSLQRAFQAAADEWLKVLKVYANRPYEGPASGSMHKDVK